MDNDPVAVCQFSCQFSCQFASGLEGLERRANKWYNNSEKDQGSCRFVTRCTIRTAELSSSPSRPKSKRQANSCICCTQPSSHTTTSQSSSSTPCIAAAHFFVGPSSTLLTPPPPMFPPLTLCSSRYATSFRWSYLVTPARSSALSRRPSSAGCQVSVREHNLI